MVRVVLEGGRSDTEGLELDEWAPPLHIDRSGERYGQVLSHYDEHLRDVAGRWRYRVVVEHQVMQPAHSAIDVRP